MSCALSKVSSSRQSKEGGVCFVSYRTSNNVSNLELFRARNWSQVSEFLCACQASTCAAAAAVAAAVAAVAAVREQGKISSVGNVHAPTNGFIDDIRTMNVVHRPHIFMVFFLLVPGGHGIHKFGFIHFQLYSFVCCVLVNAQDAAVCFGFDKNEFFVGLPNKDAILQQQRCQCKSTPVQGRR